MGTSIPTNHQPRLLKYLPLFLLNQERIAKPSS
jgi:hypothetical protein